MKAILIKNVSFVDEDFNVHENKAIVVKPPYISKIIENNLSDLTKNVDEEIDAKGCLLLPGFVNNHSHNAMTLLRGYAENLPLEKWLFDKVFPFETKMTAESAEAGVSLAILEMLRNGIVSTTDMYFFGDETVEVYEKYGVKANFGRAVVSDEDEHLAENRCFKEADELFNKYHNYADERIKIDFSIHAEYTSTEKIARDFASYMKDKDANMHIHISETDKEVLECFERHKKTPVQYFNDLGLLTKKTLGAHLVSLSDEDLDILKNSEMTVVSCPVSNLKLASGVARLKEMIDRGIKVTYGTDGTASNNSLDMFAEMKTAYILQREKYKDWSTMTPEIVLQGATTGGFLSQGRKNAGKIKEGYRADLILIKTDDPNLCPKHSITNNILFSANPSNVCMTMVDGEVLYKDGEYAKMDVEKIIFDAETQTKKILEQL